MGPIRLIQLVLIQAFPEQPKSMGFKDACFPLLHHRTMSLPFELHPIHGLK